MGEVRPVLGSTRGRFFLLWGEGMKPTGYLGVRNGLIMNPKHREKIGPALWLYLYLMANADYETRKLDRKIGTISKDMGAVPIRTVDHWIGILKRGNMQMLPAIIRNPSTSFRRCRVT